MASTPAVDAKPRRGRTRSYVDAGDQPKLCPADLNSKFSLDNFVAGPPNRVAHAAAIAVSEFPGKSYNPLFIYGDRGVGKTHLLQAICHRLFHFTRSKVVYFTSEAFLSQFVSALSDSSLEDFRAVCRRADALVIEDVHFLAHKEKTQDELFYTLNELLGAQKQVIVSSVCSPRETPGIQERLVSRFKWGLVTRLERPDFEMRVAVLLRKAHGYGQELPIEVAEFIAKHVTDNLREVEGALARVVSVASLHQCPIGLDIARMALSELLEEEQTSGTITVGQILNAVRDYYQIRSKDLLSRSKVRALVHARQMGMYLSRQLTPMSLEEIGAHFGGRDHTTVLYGLERITDQLKTQPQVRGDLQLLKSRLSSLRSL
jgi:chromosomal replication initiator protein